ncbi:tyrosine-type recombinase/integrase [Marinomonas fungiae]|uniref:Phage integrase family n=1 Tax=Marinomonas fungiae TaxID=1137284 RepID=A0A0K6IV27_9GAMM|nr:tyrosine-type recombinase/integrase [Marinomonas fungiae]CUB06976.1 Phage integrase family [Marinomonas fungiae]
MTIHPLLNKALKNSEPEFANVKLQRIGRELLGFYLVSSGSANTNTILDEAAILRVTDFQATLEEGRKLCKRKMSQLPILAFLSLDFKKLPNVIDHVVFHKLQASIFYALISSEVNFSFVTVAEAADNIRLIFSQRANSSKIKQIPNELSVVKTLEYLCNEITGQYTVSQAYLKMVRDGWNLCSSYKEELPVKDKTRIRTRRHDPSVKGLVNVAPFPFAENDLDIEDSIDVDIIELDKDAISPSVKAERELFRNRILTAKEQFGLAFVTYRLTPLELSKAIEWINNVQPTASSALGFLTILTTLKLHEVLGLHIAKSVNDIYSFKQLDDCYGIIDLESGIYWRKELDIADRFEPTEADLKWLLPHTEWLALPIPKQFLNLLREFFKNYQAGAIDQILPDEVIQNAGDLLTKACRQIVYFGGLNRRLSKKVLRYLLYGCVASKYGRHKASLIFANNEFGLSTWHYYMSDTAYHLQSAFMNTCTESLGLDFDHQIALAEGNSVIGSKLAINKTVFSERLAERLESLNVSLRSVRKSRSLDALREIYNQLVSYTVLMFCAVTSHRRNKSMFIEHYCWNEDYTSVLIADKIHFGESATRIIPVPELMTKQINNTLGWIEQIIKRVKLLDKKMAVKLNASIHRDSNASFLGLWLEHGELVAPSTSQVEVFLGEDWTLPQNAVRHLSYHTLFAFEDAVPFLDHQMGHISTDMHSFQNTSVMKYDGPEVEIHRNVISRCLEELGFSLLGRTSFSHSKMYNKGQFVPRSIQKKSHNQSKSSEQILQSDLKSLLNKAIKTDADLYELLLEHYRGDPYLHEQALLLLKKLELSNGEQTEIDCDALHSALGDYFKKSPVAKVVLPYDVMFSERNYTQMSATFYDFAEALIIHFKNVSPDTLSNLLLFSMILDGTGSLSPEKLRKAVTIDSVKYLNGYLTAKMDKGEIVFFGGLSALLLSMLVKRAKSQNICLNPIKLEPLMNDSCPEIELDKSIAKGFAKLSALFRQVHDKKMTFSKLYQLIDHAPKRTEAGALYGLRQGTLKVKGLSEHTLLRLLDRKHRYIMPSSDEATLSVIAERSFFKAKPRSNDYFKEFMADFRNKFVKYPGTSQDKITRFWQELISLQTSKKLSDLVKASQELPEIIVLVLTWLFEISGRKGQRYGGLATSSIQTYFSKLVPRLFQFAANQSLTTFGYEDFSDLYQDIIDAGDIENRAERAKILARFHSVIQGYFGVIKFDFRDLDVEANDEGLTGRIIMPWEYEQALSLLLSDEDMSPEEQFTNAAVLILCCRLGLRREEIRRLKLRDFSIEDRVLYVRTHRILEETVRVKSKSGNRRIPYALFFNAQELQILESCIERAKAQKNKSIPLFFDPINSKQIRQMDSHFSRVIEALRLVTGDPDIRLHDGRHTHISFTSSALVLEDQQSDAIAKVIKEWIRIDKFSNFQKQFMETTVATPTTRHALLPALALMVGHSNAATTLSSYTHFLEYWRWQSVEMDFKKVKTMDGTLSALAKINRKRLTEIKSEWGLSASYAVLKRIHDGKKDVTVAAVNEFKIEEFDKKPILSSRETDKVMPVINQIQNAERALRYIEDAEKQSRCAPSGNTIQPSDLQYGLTEYYVSQIRQAYQTVLTDDVAYRAYKISSNEEGVDFIGQSRLYEARNYFKEPAFYQLLTHLIRMKQSNLEVFSELEKVWAQAWYDSKKKLYIPLSQADQVKDTFSVCKMNLYLGDERINRRLGGVVYDSVPVVRLEVNNELVSIPQFSHAMFLLQLIENLSSLSKS